MTRAQKAIHALRTPDAALQRVPNTVRQSIADIIEEQRQQIDKYGLALMMIREGCADPAKFAGEILSASSFKPCPGCYTENECRKASRCFAVSDVGKSGSAT